MWFPTNFNVTRCRGSEPECVGNVRQYPHEKPPGSLDADRCGKGWQTFDFSIPDKFDRADRITRADQSIHSQIHCLIRSEHVSRVKFICLQPRQRAVRHEDSPCLHSIPPVRSTEFPIQMRIHPVITHGIRQYSGSTASLRWNPKSGIQVMGVVGLSPESISQRFRKFCEVASFSPGLSGIHAAAIHMVIGNPDRIQISGTEPDGKIQPERLFGINPSAQLLRLLHPSE